MGFEWLGEDTWMERLRRLEGACGETNEELARLGKSGVMAAEEYEALAERLAAVAVWVRASLIHGEPLLPPEEPEKREKRKKPAEPGKPRKAKD